MPRGVKKSTADKLRQELEKIRKSISDHEEKTTREVEQALLESPSKWKIGITLYFVGITLFVCILFCCFPA